jgi:hypothetical protein
VKRTNLASLVLAVTSVSLTGCATSSTRQEYLPKASPETLARFETIKSLSGHWQGAAGEPEMTSEFKVISGGNVVVETMFPGHPHEMINTYSLEGDSIVMTHYCAVGNRPHMRLQGGTEQEFPFLGTTVSNLHSQSDSAMRNMRLVLSSPDEYTAFWTGTHDAEFKMRRVK